MRNIIGIVLVVSTLGCIKDNTVNPPKDNANPTAPTDPVTPVPIDHRIEVVVQGSVTNATIKYTSEKEGTQMGTFQLPWFTRYHVDRNNTFISISATTFEAGFITVQIWVDDKLLKETTASSTFPDPVLGVTASITGNFDISPDVLAVLPSRK